MDKFNQLLKELQGLNLIQKSIEWDECLPERVWNDHFEGNFKELKTGLDVDQRRHYETSISVVEIYGRLLGIRHITNIYSESSSCEDCFVEIKFFEMEEITIKSYREI